MMFLQYLGLGAWVVPLTRYLQAPPGIGGLGFAPTQTGLVYMTLALGALVAPFFLGLLADRWFAAEKVYAVSHLVMAAALVGAGWWCETHSGLAADPARAIGPLVGLMLVYAIGCQITLTLANVISFRNLQDRDGSFGYIRLVGTFGWIVGSVFVGWAMNPLSAEPLYIAAIPSVLLAGFARTLPHTPPRGYGRPVREVLGLPALKMFRDRSFVAFAIVLFVGSLMNQFYVLFAPGYLDALGVRVNLGTLGSWGPEVILTTAQWCEMACMAATPWLLHRLGLKRLMVLGVAGWVLRGGLMYWGSIPWMLAVALPMHGWSFAFFNMMGTLFMDREAPAHLRAGTQALATFLSSGPAVILGNLVAGLVVEAHRSDGITDWSSVWLVPFLGASGALVLFATLFREPPERGIG